MLQRCKNSKNTSFKHYGARGVTVCERWKSLENFAADMGLPKVGESLDRIDPNGHYEPGNCRWATIATQANNRRNNQLIEINGATKTLAEWCRLYKAPYDRVRLRVKLGYSPEKALTTPLRGRRR